MGNSCSLWVPTLDGLIDLFHPQFVQHRSAFNRSSYLPTSRILIPISLSRFEIERKSKERSFLFESSPTSTNCTAVNLPFKETSPTKAIHSHKSVEPEWDFSFNGVFFEVASLSSGSSEHSQVARNHPVIFHQKLFRFRRGAFSIKVLRRRILRRNIRERRVY